MGTFLYYIIQSTLCLTLLCVLFHCFFRRDTLFRTNRCILMAGIVICSLLPLCKISVSTNALWGEWLNTPLSTEGSYAFTVAKHNFTDKEAPFPLHNLLAGIYIIGIGGMASLLLLSTAQMLRLMRRHPAQPYEKGIRLVICPEEIRSFSWGRTIMLSRTDAEEKGGIILLHERMHLHYRHTYDLLLMELILLLHWFNPAVWLLMHYLKEIHEFEADNGVLSEGIDTTQYQLLLVRKSVGTRLYSMASAFRTSKLKKRINMMLKERTNRLAHLKLMLFVPVVAGALMAFARQETEHVQVLPQTGNPTEYVTQDSIARDIPVPVELTLHNRHGEGNIVLKNKTLRELKKAIMEEHKNWKEDGIRTVTLKVAKETKMEVVQEVKEILRKAYMLKINYEISEETE